MELLLTMGLMLLLAKIFGSITEKFGVASLVGEVVAGIILGPILGWVILGDFLTGFLTFGIILLLFMAGMEVKFDDIKQNTYKAGFLAATGGLVSFFLGFLVGIIFFNDFLVGVAIGTAILSTSNGSLFILLMKSGKFDTSIGKFIISITIADDIVGIIALSIFNMYVSTAISLSNIFFILLVSIGFYLFVLTIGSSIVGKILNRINIFHDENMLFTLPLAVLFVMAFITNNLGLSIAAGSFLAGMAVANSHFTELVIIPKVEIMTKGFILPMFYASIGTLLMLNDLNPLLIAAIFLATISGKFIGCGLMSRILGTKKSDVRLIGVLMMPRGDENIVILQIILLLGVITTAVYTSIIFAVILTIITAPIFMKMIR